MHTALVYAYRSIDTHPVGHLGTSEARALGAAIGDAYSTAHDLILAIDKGAIERGALVHLFLTHLENPLGRALASLARGEREIHGDLITDKEQTTLRAGVDFETLGYILLCCKATILPQLITS